MRPPEQRIQQWQCLGHLQGTEPADGEGCTGSSRREGMWELLGVVLRPGSGLCSFLVLSKLMTREKEESENARFLMSKTRRMGVPFIP